MTSTLLCEHFAQVVTCTNTHIYIITSQMYTQTASEEKHLQAMIGVPDAKYTDKGSKTMYGYGYANLTTAKIMAQVFTPV